jgi:AAA+ ATPase superfamily predicted ATPase
MTRYFRQKRLIDRDNEIKFLLDWFEKVPDEILWIYGPKSSGKTTLIEYVVENELFEDFWKFKPKKNYWVRYINLRGYLITSYKTFLEAFIKPKKESKKKQEKIDARMSIGIFEINASILNEVKDREKDLFNVLISKIQEIAKDKRIIIIDEIQTLEEIYINGDRELLKEFLNFCVRLTKELHLCHVVILSSNTVFIDRIYSDAKLKVTSEFYKVKHLDYETIGNWLQEEGFQKSEVELIWDYLGGCIPLIQKMLRERKNYASLKDYLERRKWLAYTEIVDFLGRGNFSADEEKKFDEIIMEILEKGCFMYNRERKEYLPVIEKWAEKEILFFDPLDLRVTGNSRIYEKGMEMLVRSA